MNKGSVIKMKFGYLHKYSSLWRVIAVGLVCAALFGCGSDKVAGIDGSGSPVEPVAPAPEPELPIIEEPVEPVEPPPVLYPQEPLDVAAQGTINGFGSIIVHGDHYDTSFANFYRNGQLVNENAFEVGDMVGVTGYYRDGKLYANNVVFTPVLSGRIEQFDAEEGMFTLLGQRVKIDVDTVIGSDLDDEALWGEDVTVSGWQGDSYIVATRITLNKNAEVALIRGHVRSNDTASMRAYIGEVWVDYSGIASLPAMGQGDIVLFEGELIEPENQMRYIQATTAINISATLTDNQQPLDTAIVAGIVRNIASLQRFTVNGVEVSLTANSVVERGELADLASGQLVVVRGIPTAADKLEATSIKVIEFANKQSFAGSISSIDQSSIVVNGDKFDLVTATALVDLQQLHARLALDDLRIGDYVVVSAVAHEQGFEALSIKRTQLGNNDRKFDGTDVVVYQWGFPLGDPRNESGDNAVYIGRLHAAHPAMSAIEIGGATPGSEKLFIHIDATTDSYTRVYGDNETLESQQTTSDLVQYLYEQLSAGRTVWINMQAERMPNESIEADKIHYLLDRQGPVVLGKSLAEEIESRP